MRKSITISMLGLIFFSIMIVGDTKNAQSWFVGTTACLIIMTMEALEEINDARKLAELESEGKE